MKVFKKNLTQKSGCLTFQLKRSKEYTKVNMIVVIIHVLGGIEARKNTLSEKKKKKKLDYFVDTTT